MPEMKGTETSVFGTTGRFNHDSSKFYNTRLYVNQKKIETTNIHEGEVPTDVLNTTLLHSSEYMSQLPDCSVHLVVTSPPYNVAKEYDKNLSLEEYIDFLATVFQECKRVLVQGGRLCVNLANLGRKPYISLTAEVTKLLVEMGYFMRGEIIWNKAGSASPSTAWGSWQSAANPTLRDVHEYILVFSKGDYRRESKNQVNTIDKQQFIDWTKSIWTMNAESARRIGHPAPFPEELPYRLIQLYSFKGDVVLDPFMGSGTTGVAALKSDRKFVGYETVEAYVELAKNRVAAYLLEAKEISL